MLTLALVSISVFLGAFLFSDSLQKKNEEEAQKFGERMVALSKLEQTSVKIAIPGNLEINEKMLVTKNLVNAVRVKMPTRDLKEENSKQSMESMAIDFNQGIHKSITNLRKDSKTGGKFAYELLYEELLKNMTNFLRNVI